MTKTLIIYFVATSIQTGSMILLNGLACLGSSPAITEQYSMLIMIQSMTKSDSHASLDKKQVDELIGHMNKEKLKSQTMEDKDVLQIQINFPSKILNNRRKLVNGNRKYI